MSSFHHGDLRMHLPALVLAAHGQSAAGLPPDLSREQLERGMEEVVADHAAHVNYLRELNSFKNLRPAEVIPEALLNEVLRHRFGRIPNDQLIRLAINPLWLNALRMEVLDQAPEAWMHAMTDEQTERAARRAGYVPLSVDEIVAGLRQGSVVDVGAPRAAPHGVLRGGHAAPSSREPAEWARAGAIDARTLQWLDRRRPLEPATHFTVSLLWAQGTLSAALGGIGFVDRGCSAHVAWNQLGSPIGAAAIEGRDQPVILQAPPGVIPRADHELTVVYANNTAQPDGYGFTARFLIGMLRPITVRPRPRDGPD